MKLAMMTMMVLAVGMAGCVSSGNGGATGAAPDRYMGERANVERDLERRDQLLKHADAADQAGQRQWRDQRRRHHPILTPPSCPDEPDYLSGITISCSLVSTTNMASSFAGAVELAFWLTW